MRSKIDHKEIIKLIDLLEERNLQEFELEVEGFKIKISRGYHRAPDASDLPPSAPSPEAKTSAPTSESPPEHKKNNLHIITSPIVGTFYRSADPSSPPFVDIGDAVKKNQTLCIIEAMKLMNEIESDVDGTLEEIFAENGKPVEYGKKLFAIKPGE